MGACVYGAGLLGGDGASWWRNVGVVALMTLVGPVVYGLWSIWLKMDELGWLIAKSTAASPGSAEVHRDDD
jgi:predicted DNA repair protein MutK